MGTYHFEIIVPDGAEPEVAWHFDGYIKVGGMRCTMSYMRELIDREFAGEQFTIDWHHGICGATLIEIFKDDIPMVAYHSFAASHVRKSDDRILSDFLSKDD
jgi:hypothetical protein